MGSNLQKLSEIREEMIKRLRNPTFDAIQAKFIRRNFSASYLKNHGGCQESMRIAAMEKAQRKGKSSANKNDGMSLRRIAEMEKAQENKYFRELQMKQIKNLKFESESGSQKKTGTQKNQKQKTLELDKNRRDEIEEMNAELAALKAELSQKIQKLAELNQENSK